MVDVPEPILPNVTDPELPNALRTVGAGVLATEEFVNSNVNLDGAAVAAVGAATDTGCVVLLSGNDDSFPAFPTTDDP